MNSCGHCEQVFGDDAGRLPSHSTAPGLRDVCPGSGGVPWRQGVPSDAAVRAMLQGAEELDSEAAFFQFRYLGVFHGVVFATPVGEAVVWEYMLPSVAGEEHGAPLRFDNDRVPWWFRPLDLETGDPRAWIDPTEGT